MKSHSSYSLNKDLLSFITETLIYWLVKAKGFQEEFNQVVPLAVHLVYYNKHKNIYRNWYIVIRVSKKS